MNDDAITLGNDLVDEVLDQIDDDIANQYSEQETLGVRYFHCESIYLWYPTHFECVPIHSMNSLGALY